MKLIRPDNKQSAEVMQVSIGRIALDTTCITPAVRCFPLAELAAVNGMDAVAQACKTPEPVYTCEPPLTIVEYGRQKIDNVLALTEVLNGRDVERQKSRDLYVYELSYQILDAIGA